MQVIVNLSKGYASVDGSPRARAAFLRLMFASGAFGVIDTETVQAFTWGLAEDRKRSHQSLYEDRAIDVAERGSYSRITREGM